MQLCSCLINAALFWVALNIHFELNVLRDPVYFVVLVAKCTCLVNLAVTGDKTICHKVNVEVISLVQSQNSSLQSCFSTSVFILALFHCSKKKNVIKQNASYNVLMVLRWFKGRQLSVVCSDCTQFLMQAFDPLLQSRTESLH